MTSVALNATASVTLDSSGGGTAKVGPASAGETWQPQVASVVVSPVPPAATVANSPVCKVYVGADVGDTTFIDGTWTGEQDSTDNVRASSIRQGQYVFAVWTGGDPGAGATLIVTGTKDVP